jgi:predicted negative regulator of RcsB-dependent stress response
MTEEEQVEQLKNWIKQYGMAIVAGIAMALIIVSCWHYWQGYQTRILTRASQTNASMRAIAKTRMARIYIAQNKADAALALLKNVEDKHFNGLIDEIKGDAYLMQNDTTKAKASYQLALKELPAEEVTQRPLLQMKLDNLATASDAT